MKIIVAGDFCPINRVGALFEQERYSAVLGQLREKVEKADYAIVNFECPVAEDNERPIVKRGPHLKCDVHGVEAVKWAGFDCVTLANNHFLDYGEKAVEHTLNALRKHGLDMVGGGMNLDQASQILYKEIAGKRLAVINCCEHEFSLATETTAGSNPLNPVGQYYAIREARAHADYVLVIVHGGYEMFQLPSPRMQETYRFFIDAGADAVVNHHQHCYSGYEVYKGKPIFYGLGNLCFDFPHITNPIWFTGMMVSLSFEGENVRFDIFPYTQNKGGQSVTFMEGEEAKAFYSHIEELNSTIANTEALAKAVKKYFGSKQRRTLTTFEPIQNRYLSGLQARGYLPSLVSTKRMAILFNSILCQSHRDKVEFMLEEWRKKQNK